MKLLRFTDFFFRRFFERVFVSSLLDLSFKYIASSHITAETFITIAKYLPFSKFHVARFQT